MPPSPLELLRHILDEVDYLERASLELPKEAYLRDETLKRSFVRSLEIIGEATKKISRDWRDRHEGVEWRAMAGMRDRLIHNYFAVDHDIVWDVVIHKLPELRARLEDIIRDEGEAT